MGYSFSPVSRRPDTLVAPASPCRAAILGRELAMQSQPRAWGPCREHSAGALTQCLVQVGLTGHRSQGDQ